ncbi:MAG: putative glycoside hydrolase [Armatimonadota bacterium]
MDLIIGIGDFTTSTYTVRAGGDQYGEPSLPNDTVANGWSRRLQDGLTINNFICNLTEAPGYQYIALRNITSGEGSLSLATSVAVDDSDSYRPHSGDTVTFVVDRVRMRDWNDSYFTSLSINIFAVGFPLVSKQIEYSESDCSKSVSMKVPQGAGQIVVFFQFYTNGNLGPHVPAVFLSGAHLYLTRASKTACEMEEIPAIKNRNIATQLISWQENEKKLRPTSANYDEISVPAWSYCYYAALRKINPNVRLYLYQGGTTIADTPRNSRWSICPMRFSDASKSHPDWLYSAAPGAPNKNGYIYAAPFEDRFYAHITATTYQELWVATVLEKVRHLGLDGVWIDDCGSLTVDHNGIRRDPYEVQQFLHYVIPKLKSAGLTVVINLAEANLNGNLSWNGNPPLAYFDPSWKPNSQFTESGGYSANTPDNTPDVLFREYSFILNGFRANSSYWLACLNDSNIVAQWNSALPANQRKRIHYSISQKDSAEHPAYGNDGWARFVLASYLLCQNEYTAFGIDVVGKDGASYASQPNIDYSITKRLGDPDGAHQSYNGDQYLRYRRYKATSDGGVGGIVVVNGNANSQKKFVVDMDVVDESGNPISSGTEITLKAMTGRILLRRAGSVDVTITVPTENVFPGQILDVTVEYTNSSGSEARNVVVRANVPDETNYVNGSAEASDGHYDRATNSVYWTIASLQAAGSGVKKFKVKVK